MSRAPGAVRGWTIIDFVLGLSLATAVAAGAYGLTRVAVVGFLSVERSLERGQAARRALDRIIEELRWAETIVGDSACPPSNLCASRVRAAIPAANPYRRDEAYEVTFQHNAVQREVERRVGTGVNNLAAHVDAVTFVYLLPDGTPASSPADTARIRVSVRVYPRNGYPLVIDGEVRLRNRLAPPLSPAP
jgi:hypothetical protein